MANKFRFRDLPKGRVLIIVAANNPLRFYATVSPTATQPCRPDGKGGWRTKSGVIATFKPNDLVLIIDNGRATTTSRQGGKDGK